MNSEEKPAQGLMVRRRLKTQQLLSHVGLVLVA